MHSRKSFFQQNRFLCILATVTLISIAGTGIWFHQSFWQILPLFISLCVMFLQAKVNRYNFLVGGCNSILYAISYFSMTLYASAAYALFLSFPLQIISFFNWNKKTTEHVTELRRLTAKQRIFYTVGLMIAWLILFVVVSAFGSVYWVWDNTATLLGIVATVLSMLRFTEYTVFQIMTQIISLVMHIRIFWDTPSQITYIIYSVYALLCTILAIIRIQKNQRFVKKA